MAAAERRRTIRLDHLARVEGHGALTVKLRGSRVVDAQLRLFEAPRFFEGLLAGRDYTEAPDITARICGICPVAYQMSACHAMEAACGAEIDGPLRALRRLLYCGEWIASHAFHIYMLHAPDFLGVDDAIALARRNPDLVRRGLELKQAGNAVLATLGGREIHPINVRVGGFYRTPPPAELAPLRDRLTRARDQALETARFTGTLDYPELELDCELVALRHDHEYPMNEGRLVSTGGLDIGAAEFEQHVEERYVAHTNALQARIRDRGAYLTGPMARYTLNHDRLGSLALEAAVAAGLGEACRNPYRSIGVRAVEMVQACDDALAILAAYEPPARPALEVRPRAATGAACTEAPRGTLYHRYELAADGTIRSARIVPPTSQNQLVIEDSLRRTVEAAVQPKRRRSAGRAPAAGARAARDAASAELTAACERVIRCYDPCISCATHFLALELDRT